MTVIAITMRLVTVVFNVIFDMSIIIIIVVSPLLLLLLSCISMKW